jgi:putative hydrolases of HD superfamily
MQPNTTLLALFRELQNLDRVPRAGYVLRGVPDGESVAEHSWHVVFMVWALGMRMEGLDLARAVGIALVHDLAEIRVGDLPSTAGGYFPEGAKKSAEAAAMADILGPLPASARELYDEYQAQETREARLVKACDKLQLMVKVDVYQRWGAGGLAEFWRNPANFPRDPRGDLEPVREVFEELLAGHPEAVGTAEEP